MAFSQWRFSKCHQQTALFHWKPRLASSPRESHSCQILVQCLWSIELIPPLVVLWRKELEDVLQWVTARSMTKHLNVQARLPA